MASTYSTSLRLELMATGDQSGTWGDTTNTNLGTLLEQAITGVLSVSQGDAELTLTSTDGASDQARNAVVNLTGAMTGAQNVIVPDANKLYTIKNSTTGGFSVVVKTASGTGVSVPPGASIDVYCDGTNVVSAANYWSGQIGGQVYLDAGATAGPVHDLFRDSTSPATNDILGQVLFNGRDSAGNKQEYASIDALIASPTSTSEVGALDIYTTIGGTRTRTMSVGPNNPNTPTQFINGYATTTTAAGTTVLTVASAQSQYFTGTSTQTVTLPVVSTLVLGQLFEIANLSTGAVTVNSSGGNLVTTVSAGYSARVQAVLVTGTTAASWNVVTAAVAAATTSAAGIVELAFGGMYNLGLAASVGSSALTIAIKGVDGNDPSASNPVVIPLRNVTAATGTPSYLTLSAATSLVINSTATMAFSNATAGRIWIVLFNDGGTARVGAINCWNGADIYPLGAQGIASSTTVGTGSDNAHVFYTDSGVTSKAYAVLGYAEWSAGLTTAGTWDIVPTRLQLFDADTPLPGQVVQFTRTQTGAVATGSTQIPIDDTIPQSGEGFQVMAAPAITPVSAANVRRTTVVANMGHAVNSAIMVAAAFKDSDAGAFAASLSVDLGTNGNAPAASFDDQRLFGSTSATTIKCRIGSGSVGTTTFNGANSGRLLGGVMASSLQVSEIMA